MEDIRKIVKPLQKSGLLVKGILGANKNETKNKKEDFLQCY